MIENNRLEDNLKIIELLTELVNKYPHQRFGQLLLNYMFHPKTTEIIIKDKYDGVIWNTEGSYFIKRLNNALKE